MDQDQTDPGRWVGRTEVSDERVDASLAKRVAATLGQDAPREGKALPDLWHWAYFHEPVAAEGLGVDGHAALGGFLPPAGRRNRMWAGGRLEFHHPLIVGAHAGRRSTILAVEEKRGRSGALLFVTVRHDYEQDGRLAIREEHDIVYREPSPPRTEDRDPLPLAQWSERIVPDATLLFRYSAVTFNGHRIHYDWPYATEREGYAGLVVHGPLISTLLLRAFQQANPRARVTHMAYRGVRPLISPRAFAASGRIVQAGQAQLWAANEEGALQHADIRFV